MKNAAWVITWSWLGDKYRVEPNPVYILNPHWSIDRVVSVMQALYMNSDIHSLVERLRFFRRFCNWPCRRRLEGPRILIGDNPFLIASRVNDLHVEYDIATGIESACWTQPSGNRVDSTSLMFKVQKMGQPTPKTWTRQKRSSKVAHVIAAPLEEPDR